MKLSPKRLMTAVAVLAAALALAVVSAKSCNKQNGDDSDDSPKTLPDTLRVATLYSPSSYFIYRDEPMGYDYSLITRFANDKGIGLELTVAPSLHRALEMLDSGYVDIIAYEIPEIGEYKDDIVACGPKSETHQVLVQMKSDSLINDVTQLPGKQIYVEANTKYLYRLQNLDDELGGGIDINVVDTDTLKTDDLINMVADGEVPLTVADNNIAAINATYNPRLDVSLALSFPQSSAWAVSAANKWLGDSIDAWLGTDVSREYSADLHRRYFESLRVGDNAPALVLKNGRISAYDKLFRDYAPKIGWDWRLLASACYQESKFNPDAVSWAGARGLMQIMPATARNYGFDPEALGDPETSVSAAIKVFADLDKSLKGRVSSDSERLKFVLAAYNSGLGHVVDAIALANKYSLDPTRWEGNVEKAMLMKSEPEYYNDPVVKCGYFRGRETVAYVDKVLGYFDRFKREIKS